MGEIKNLARRASEGHPQKTTVNDVRGLLGAYYFYWVFRYSLRLFTGPSLGIVRKIAEKEGQYEAPHWAAH